MAGVVVLAVAGSAIYATVGSGNSTTRVVTAPTEGGAGGEGAGAGGTGTGSTKTGTGSTKTGTGSTGTGTGTGSTGTGPASTSSTTTVPATPTTGVGIFAQPAIASYLAGQTAETTAAVIDLDTGATSLYHPGIQEYTASIVKVDILATLLTQQGGTLTADEQATATSMIEHSDNDSATDLWNEIGGSDGLAAFDAKAGLTDTDPGQDGYWGVTLTTAADQARLLEDLVIPSGVTPPDAGYELGLMQSVETDQSWGITAGVAAGVPVSVKNGWLPLEGDGDWQVNSIGWVDGAGRDYVIAVLTKGSATEGGGIDDIEGLSTLVWSALAPSS